LSKQKKSVTLLPRTLISMTHWWQCPIGTWSRWKVFRYSRLQLRTKIVFKVQNRI